MIKSKPKTKKFMPNKIYILLGFVAILAMVGWYIKSMMVSPQVALIAESSKQMCITNISSMSFHDECGNPGTFKRAVYTCSNGSTAEKLASGTSCITYGDILKEAQNNCGQTCTGPSPVPSPSLIPSPTPYPTLAPSPSPVSGNSFSCNVQVYKLREGDDPKASSNSYATPDRRVDPNQTRASAGEFYALIVEETSNIDVKVSTISAVTENVSGSNEPIKVVATSAYCKSTDSWGKYMSCTHPDMSFTANTPVPLKIGMTIEIQNNIYEMYKTSIRFGLYNILRNTGYKSDCFVTLQSSESVSTPTPVPTLTPGCYTESRFCLQGLLGGKCPVATVCPSATPTPTPTPTPVPSPVYSSKPSPIPTPISCGTTLNKWQFRESCGAKMYRYIDFNCSGTTASQVFGNPNICKSEAEWVAEARTTCMNAKCASPTPTPQMTTKSSQTLTTTPTPVPTLIPRSVTKQSFSQCYKTCRYNKRGAISCVRDCVR